jgi:hypothetical protein
MDPEEGVDDEYKSVHNKVFTWKFIRGVAENDLTKLSSFNNKEKPCDIEYLALEYVSEE